MKKFILKHTEDAYYTHQPVTGKILSMANKGDIVLELGCGMGSTPLFNFFAKERGIIVKTFESDLSWLNRFKDEYSCETHNFYHILDNNWQVLSEYTNKNIFLCFIDQSPWEARKYSFNLLKEYSQYIILHDCDYFPNNNMIGKTISPLISEDTLGKRDYSSDIKFFKEFFPLKGEFKYLTGPPTLLASQYNNVDIIEIDYKKREISID